MYELRMSYVRFVAVYPSFTFAFRSHLIRIVDVAGLFFPVFQFVGRHLLVTLCGGGEGAGLYSRYVFTDGGGDGFAQLGKVAQELGFETLAQA